MTNILKCVQFSVGSFSFYMTMEKVLGFRKATRLQVTPEQAFFGQIIDSDGEIPVIHGGHLFETQSKAPLEDSQLVVLGLQGGRIGLLVDKIHHLTQMNPKQILAAPQGLNWRLKPMIRGFIFHKNKYSPLLLAEGILNDKPNQPAPKKSIGLAAMPGPTPSLGSSLIMFQTGKVSFKGKRVCFGLSVTQVAEIGIAAPASPLPCPPANCLGLFHWRGHIVPIFDLNQTLNFPKTPKQRAKRYLVARTALEEGLMAFPVMKDIQILKEFEAFKPVRPAIAYDPQLVLGFFENDQQLLILPHLENILQYEARKAS